LIVQFGSDTQRLLMEVPLLSVSSILSLNNDVSVIDVADAEDKEG
jgi:hypothetical protein